MESEKAVELVIHRTPDFVLNSVHFSEARNIML